ncbi:hypothetical protein CMI38_00180 [Candidatus Pacearchaeota archaeon]|jgi:hypothetical protein|nr:hypothetical protein [Candidatus Pacearchaeota archaeon]|tara:strand:- start:474 stop:1016 length:543 start_codon:yes stop_codon:yes gene_type:complete
MASLFENKSSYVEFNNEDLLVVGASGIIKKLRTQNKRVDMSKYNVGVKNFGDQEHGLHFLQLSPPVEVVVGESFRKRAEIRGLGFDRNAIRQTMDEIVAGVNFIADNTIDPNLKEKLGELYGQESETYRECAQIARSLNTDQESAWGYVRYAGFLIAHKGYDAIRAQKQSARKFGLRLSR